MQLLWEGSVSRTRRVSLPTVIFMRVYQCFEGISITIRRNAEEKLFLEEFLPLFMYTKA